MRDLFVLRDRTDDEIVVVANSSDHSEEGEAAMKAKTEPARRTPKQPGKEQERGKQPERGINLDVLGRAIIAQAEERIRWHKQAADTMGAELKALPGAPGGPASGAQDWKHLSRRTDLQVKIAGHLEYARFLSFVRENIVGGRRYRLGLTDMATLEIMPKGTYW